MSDRAHTARFAPFVTLDTWAAEWWRNKIATFGGFKEVRTNEGTLN